ncbi:hypothetical protein [Tardiphaga sp. 803_E3_N1_3]|jgi:hypothetical protein|uniref:hypothetical protein n=1 Tax=Tardiphaga sp. 803_E3_N1_3 TaxID=3240785 RepID=UPI003F1ED959
MANNADSDRHEVNRRNAAKSTGPRTAAGKGKSAKNALRHGLNVPLPEYSAVVDKLADHLINDLVGVDVEEAAIEAARAIATYDRVSDAYAFAYGRLAVPIRILPPPPVVAEGLTALEAVMTLLADQLKEPEAAPPLTLPEFAKQLSTLARYERRAYSRRMRALRQFDAAVAKAKRGRPPGV